MHVFDAHTHFFGREFYEFQTRLTPNGSSEILLKRIADAGVEIPPPDPARHRDRIVAEMDDNGIARAVTYASVPEEMPSVGEAALRSAGRLVPYAVANPTAPASLEMLARLQPRYRFRGVLLFPAMHDYPIGGDAAATALDFARDHAMVAFVHCGLLRVRVRELIGLSPDFPLDYGHPADLAPVAASREDQTFIVPHFGAGLFEEFLSLGSRCGNVYADTAGSNAWAAQREEPLTLADLFRETKKIYGVERILFGSDSAGFPRGYRRDILDAQIEAMMDAGFTDAERGAVLGGNLARLLDLPWPFSGNTTT